MGIKHPIAQWVNNLNINGFTDWYIPSKDELNQLYNNISDLFKKGWYWSSTQHSARNANVWLHNLASGNQNYFNKDDMGNARAIRRVAFNHSNFNLYDETDGGFYAGKYTLDGVDYALIVAPKEQGEAIVQWKVENSATEGVDSEFDGLANTLAMLKADSAKEGVNIVKSKQWTRQGNFVEIGDRKLSISDLNSASPDLYILVRKFEDVCSMFPNTQQEKKVLFDLVKEARLLLDKIDGR